MPESGVSSDTERFFNRVVKTNLFQLGGPGAL